MSTNAYLKPEATSIFFEGTDSDSQYLGHADGLKVLTKNGHFLCMPEDGIPFPEEYVGLVEYFTYYLMIPLIAKREFGIYRHKTAVADVMPNTAAVKDVYLKIEIKSDKLEDAWELAEMIRIGTIRPTDSYQRPQDGLSYDELKGQISKLEGQVADLRDQNQDLVHRQFELVQIRDSTLSLFNGIDKYGFFFFMKAPRDILSSLREKIAASIRHGQRDDAE